MWQRSKKKGGIRKSCLKENLIHISEQKYKTRADLDEVLLALTS